MTLPYLSRPVALAVLATLAVKGGARSKPDLARDLVDALAERFAHRTIRVVADAAYGCGAFAGVGDDTTMITKAHTTAVFCDLAPPRTGKRGRPRLKGDRIGTLTDIARCATWTTHTVARYGTIATVTVTQRRCLWCGTWRTDPIRVILIRETGLVFTVAGAMVAVLAGASNYRQVGSQVADLPQSLLAKLGASWNWFQRRDDWPCEPTLRRVSGEHRRRAVGPADRVVAVRAGPSGHRGPAGDRAGRPSVPPTAVLCGSRCGWGW